MLGSFIRSLIVGLYLLSFLIISIPLMLIFLIIRLFSKKACDYISFYWVTRPGLGVAAWLAGIRYHITGHDLIPRDEACLFIGNHLSIEDIIALYPLMVRPTGFIAKKEMKKFPIVNLLMMFVHCFFLDREDPREGLKMINSSSDAIKNGISIFIFPEGTRSKTGELMEFKEGSFKIATKAKCPVIPVRIGYDAPVFEDHIPFFKKTNVTITFGAPIITKDWDRKEFRTLGAKTHEIISNM